MSPAFAFVFRVPTWDLVFPGWWLGHPSKNCYFVNWDDEIPNINGTIQKMATKPPTSFWRFSWKPLRVEGFLDRESWHDLSSNCWLHMLHIEISSGIVVEWTTTLLSCLWSVVITVITTHPSFGVKDFKPQAKHQNSNLSKLQMFHPSNLPTRQVCCLPKMAQKSRGLEMDVLINTQHVSCL